MIDLPNIDNGDRVRDHRLVMFCHTESGYAEEQRRSREYLKPGYVYRVSNIEVHSSSSTLELMDFPGVRFSTVMFCDWPPAAEHSRAARGAACCQRDHDADGNCDRHQPQPPPATEGDEVEAVARAIYDELPFESLNPYAVKPPWRERGNSIKQEKARKYARAAIAALRDRGQGKGEAGSINPTAIDRPLIEGGEAAFLSELADECDRGGKEFGKGRATGIRETLKALRAAREQAKGAREERDGARRLVKKVADAVRPYLLELAEQGRTGILSTDCPALLMAERAKLQSELAAVRERVAVLDAAVHWALGERDTFPLRPEGSGAYWWRSELRQRAGLAPNIASPPGNG